MNYGRALSRDATPTSTNTTAVCEAMCNRHIIRENSNKHRQSAVISIWIEVTLPDWIPLTHWMANMRMCGCGPRAYTELTCIHPHIHIRIRTRTRTHTLLKCELLSLVEYKRRFSFSSLIVKSCETLHVKSNHMCFSDRCWFAGLWRIWIYNWNETKPSARAQRE